MGISKSDSSIAIRPPQHYVSGTVSSKTEHEHNTYIHLHVASHTDEHWQKTQTWKPPTISSCSCLVDHEENPFIKNMFYVDLSRSWAETVSPITGDIPGTYQPPRPQLHSYWFSDLHTNHSYPSVTGLIQSTYSLDVP